MQAKGNGVAEQHQWSLGVEMGYACDTIVLTICLPDGRSRSVTSPRSPVPLMPDAFLDLIETSLAGMNNADPTCSPMPDAIAIAIEAQLDGDRAMALTMPPFAAWKGYPLRDAVSRRFNGVPVRLHTATECLLAGGMQSGALRGIPSAWLVECSRTITGALWRDGMIVVDPFVETFAHLTVSDADERCACGGIGHLDAVASARTIVRRMIGAMIEYPATEAAVMSATNRRAEALTMPQIWHLACEGDPVASEIMDQAQDALARAIVAGKAAVHPAIILLGGTLAQCGESWRADLRGRMQEYATPSQAFPEIRLAPWQGAAMHAGMAVLALGARRYTESSGERTTESGGNGHR